MAKINVYRPNIENYWLKMLVYGKPGSGKTTFGATADDHELAKNVLFLNAEGGMLSVTNRDPVPLSVDINSYSDMRDTFWWLANEEYKEDGLDINTVVIDSGTEIQVMNLEAIVQEKMGQKTSKGKARTGIDDVWLEDYGDSTTQLRRMYRQFRDLPMHVIITCLESRSQDNEKREQVTPLLTPKLCESVCGYMDVVGYLYADEVENDDGEKVAIRRMLCQEHGKFFAKDRSPLGKLGMVLNNPTVPKIMEKLIGGNN